MVVDDTLSPDAPSAMYASIDLVLDMSPYEAQLLALNLANHAAVHAVRENTPAMKEFNDHDKPEAGSASGII